jgi:acyl-coenzyme A synthetase/AMP-(fatty) acid ligase
MYHTTETGTVACDRKPTIEGSVGKTIEGVDVRVGDGKRAVGESGPIWVKSRSIARDVVGPSAAQVSRPRSKGDATPVPVGGFDGHGWFRTGDVGHIDKAGRIFLSGREDQLVKVDGKRVALGEVAGCLESFPKVQRAHVKVITDPLGGPMVVAQVVVFGKCGAEEIIDHCAKNLAPYKVPRRIEFCEELPA